MKNKSTNHISVSEHLILLGIGLAALYWILESAMDAFVFQEGTIIERITGASLNEIWMRVLIMGIIIIFAVYAQVVVARRKRAERESKILEEKYSTLVERGNDGIIVIQDGVLKFANRKVVEITGFSQDKVIGKQFANFIAPAYRGSVIERYKKRLRGEKVPDRYEVEILAKDGSKIPVEVSASVIEYEARPADMAIITDISERKKREKELQKRTHDLDERVKELKCLYGISGLVEKRHVPLPEILERAIHLICSAWQYPEITCARIILRDEYFKTDNFRETAWKQAADIVVHNKQIGTLEVFYLEERPESDEGPFLKEERILINAIADLLGGIIDHKEAEEEVTRVAEDLRRVIETVNAPIIGVDVKGLVSEWNQKAANITGYSKDEVLGRNFIEDFVGDDYKTSVQEVSAKALKGEETASLEFSLNTKDGRLVIVLFNATAHLDASGNIIGVFGIGQDISERKKIEQMKSDFVSLASHELRTPLTSIAGYVELILDGDVGEISKEQREFLEIVFQNTQRLETLINDVLDIEKIESGRVKIRQGKVNLNEIVEDCINTFKVMAEGKGLQLEKDVKTSPINVLGDSDRLSQVFSNLLSNAIKYTKEGRVKVTAQIKGKFASVAVEDTGLGMSSEDMKMVFTRFFRAEDSYVRKTTGSGLGLSIAKATIENHNGDIRVESKLGVGTKFEVILPLLKEAKKVD